MTRWEELEEYLWDREAAGEDFNHAALVEDTGWPNRYATRMLAAYQQAQARPKSRTLFVLSRVPGTRTSSTMWHVGARSEDARAQSKQWSKDAFRRIERQIEPNLRRIGEKNPRALPAVKAVLKGIEGSLELMAALLDPDED